MEVTRIDSISSKQVYHGRRYNLKKYSFIISPIDEELKQIDPGFFVLYNKDNDSFEIHNSNQISDISFYMAVPYDRLDQRTIDDVRKFQYLTNRQIIEEMDRHNDKLDMDKLKGTMDTIGEMSKDIYQACAQSHKLPENIDLSMGRMF